MFIYVYVYVYRVCSQVSRDGPQDRGAHADAGRELPGVGGEVRLRAGLRGDAGVPGDARRLDSARWGSYGGLQLGFRRSDAAVVQVPARLPAAQARQTARKCEAELESLAAHSIELHGSWSCHCCQAAGAASLAEFLAPLAELHQLPAHAAPRGRHRAQGLAAAQLEAPRPHEFPPQLLGRKHREAADAAFRKSSRTSSCD